jgi:hypothetical protein
MSGPGVNATIAGWRVATRRAARRSRHWERDLGRDDFVNGQFGENSPSGGFRTMRCAPATASGSAARSSRSPSRG